MNKSKKVLTITIVAITVIAAIVYYFATYYKVDYCKAFIEKQNMSVSLERCSVTKEGWTTVELKIGESFTGNSTQYTIDKNTLEIIDDFMGI